MRLRREASLGLGAILGLQILLSMLAIVLLTRMGPAIERILEENVYSGEAVEDMIALLALTPPGPVPETFEAARQRARDNVTEAAEGPRLAAIEAHHRGAFAGDPAERAALVEALRGLGQVNRDSMTRADLQAKRLGQAGAWAAALLGALALGLGIAVYRRLRLRLELPIEHLRRTTQQVRAGNVQVRAPGGDGPIEVKQIAADLNWILDRWQQQDPATAAPHRTRREAEVRRALAWLLDQQAVPVALLDADGQKIAAHADLLKDDIPAETSVDWAIEAIPGTGLRAARRTGPAADAPTEAAVE